MIETPCLGATGVRRKLGTAEVLGVTSQADAVQHPEQANCLAGEMSEVYNSISVDLGRRKNK
jgi:hypothetical protein